MSSVTSAQSWVLPFFRPFHFKANTYFGKQKLNHIACTANIFNVIFTIFTVVPVSNVIPLYCQHSCQLLLEVQWNNVNTDLQWFTVISTLLQCRTVMCMANTCNFYTFLWVFQFRHSIYLQCD